MFHEVLTGERLVRDVNRESDSLWPMIQWYHAMPQYKGAAEVCKYLLKYNASERISAQDFLARIVTVLPKKLANYSQAATTSHA